MIGIDFIFTRTVDAGAPVTAPNVGAYLIPTVTDVSRFALVDIYAAPAIVAQSVPLRAAATVRTGTVLANPHAQIARLVLDALVHILAGAVVRCKFVARFASAPIRAVVIDTPLVAQSGNLTALVHIYAGDEILRVGLLEASLAVTPIRADRIDAYRVVRTHLALVQIALVYILAPMVPTDDVTRRTEANVATAFVFAYLTGAALGLAGAALVYV